MGSMCLIFYVNCSVSNVHREYMLPGQLSNVSSTLLLKHTRIGRQPKIMAGWAGDLRKKVSETSVNNSYITFKNNLLQLECCLKCVIVDAVCIVHYSFNSSCRSHS